MNKDVLVSDVSINTLAVEVKVIKIGSKQVTQSVFKQLPHRWVIDPTSLIIRGNPWGWVNYHSKEICPFYSNDHFHIVFVLDGILYRSDIGAFPFYVPGSPYEYRRSVLFKESGAEAADAYQGMYKDAYYELYNLDQLFIAV